MGILRTLNATVKMQAIVKVLLFNTGSFSKKGCRIRLCSHLNAMLE